MTTSPTWRRLPWYLGASTSWNPQGLSRLLDLYLLRNRGHLNCYAGFVRIAVKVTKVQGERWLSEKGPNCTHICTPFGYAGTSGMRLYALLFWKAYQRITECWRKYQRRYRKISFLFRTNTSHLFCYNFITVVQKCFDKSKNARNYRTM
jgi:hypothetical protein